MQRTKWQKKHREHRQLVYDYYCEHGQTETADYFNLTRARVSVIVKRMRDDQQEN